MSKAGRRSFVCKKRGGSDRWGSRVSSSRAPRAGSSPRPVSRPPSMRSSFTHSSGRRLFAGLSRRTGNQNRMQEPLGRGGLLGEAAIRHRLRGTEKPGASRHEVASRRRSDPIPKTVRPVRLKGNVGALDFRSTTMTCGASTAPDSPLAGSVPTRRPRIFERLRRLRAPGPQIDAVIDIPTFNRRFAKF